jgi:hypothetical protein
VKECLKRHLAGPGLADAICYLRREMRDSRCSAVAIVLALAGRAAAQGVIYQADGTVNTGFTETSQSVAAPDPMPAPGDVRSTSTGTLFTEIRPGIMIQSGTPRVTWRLGYLFSGIVALASESSLGYTNQGNFALAAELSKFTIFTLNASAAQGGTSFLLGQQAADMGQPQIRAPGNPSLVTATAGELVAWEAGRHTNVTESVQGAMNAPQDDLSARNTSLTGSLSLNQQLDDRDIGGLEVRGNVSTLQPLQLGLAGYTSYASSIRLRWNRDISRQWNGFAAVGIGQEFTDTGSKPLAFFPVGQLAARYSFGSNAIGAIEYVHDIATNLQVGTVSLTDQLTARGSILFSVEKRRVLSFSTGFLHNQPIGDASILVVAATGDAVQGDVGFTTALSKNILATARYSVGYQFGQDSTFGGFGPTLIQILFVGITGRYSNTEQFIRPVPTRGQRVDGSDGVGFPVVVDAPADTPAETPTEKPVEAPAP